VLPAVSNHNCGLPQNQHIRKATFHGPEYLSVITNNKSYPLQYVIPEKRPVTLYLYVVYW